MHTYHEQVLKKRLSMNEPSIMAGNFAYEEGADLEPDEVAANAKLLPTVLDEAQDFTCQLVISHKVFQFLLYCLMSS